MKTWVNRLKNNINNLNAALAEAGIPNDFLKHIEFGKDRFSNSSTIIFTSDKMGDPQVEALFKQAFIDLGSDAVKAVEDQLASEGNYVKSHDTDSNNQYSNISLDLIKYLLISKGLDFGRTSYSMLLPDSFYSSLSDKLENEFDDYTGLDLENKENSNLARLEGAFMLQFAINNSNLLTNIPTNDSSVYMSNNKEEVVINGKKYDLVLKGKNYPGFVTYKYGDKVRIYAKVEEIQSTLEGQENPSNFSAYRFVSYADYNNKIFLAQKTKNLGFDLNKVISAPIVMFDELEGNTYITEDNKDRLLRGTNIFVRDKSDIGLQSLNAYNVTDITIKENKVHYTLTPIGLVDTSSSIQATSARQPLMTNLEGLEAADDLLDLNPEISDETSLQLTAPDIQFLDHVERNLPRTTKEHKRKLMEQNVEAANKAIMKYFSDLIPQFNLGNSVTVSLSYLLEKFSSDSKVDPKDLELFKLLMQVNPDYKVDLNKLQLFIYRNTVSITNGDYDPAGDKVRLNLGTISTIDGLAQLIKHVNHEIGHRNTFAVAVRYKEAYANNPKDPSIPKPVRDIFDTYAYLNSIQGTEEYQEILKQYAEGDAVKEYYATYYGKSIEEFINAIFVDNKYGELMQKVMYKKASLFDKIKMFINSLINYIVGKKVFTNFAFNSPSYYFRIANINADSLKKDPSLALRIQDKLNLVAPDPNKDRSNNDTPKFSNENMDKLLQHPTVNGVYLEEDIVDGKYKDTKGGSYNRLTEFITHNFLNKKVGQKEAEYYATLDYKRQGLSTDQPIKITIGKKLKEFTYEELVKYHVIKGNNFKR